MKTPLLLALLCLPVVAQDSKPASMPSLAQLVEELKAKEKKSDAVVLEMSSKAWLGGDRVLATTGTMRVLSTTHVHVRMNADFGDGMTGENETVKTPDGVWTREKDPSQGTVYTFVPPELLARLEAAMKVLGGGDADVPGVPNDISAARGSALLESLAQSFDLTVARTILVDKEECYVVEGKSKTAPAKRAAEDFDLPEPDQIEVLVRKQDHVLATMRQFKDGKPLLEVKITRIEFPQTLSKESFAITPPEGVRFKNVMDHPPAREQIERILAEADAKKKKGG